MKDKIFSSLEDVLVDAIAKIAIELISVGTTIAINKIADLLPEEAA